MTVRLCKECGEPVGERNQDDSHDWCRQCFRVLKARSNPTRYDKWLEGQLRWLAFIEEQGRTVDELPGDLEICGPVGLTADGWVDFPVQESPTLMLRGGTVASLGQQYLDERRAAVKRILQNAAMEGHTCQG